MKIEVSLFLIIFLVIVVHTILQHLINWGWRNADDEFTIVGMIFLTIIEIAVFISVLSNIL